MASIKFALSLLPAADIEIALQGLMEKNQSPLRHTWVEGNIWTLVFWSLFGNSVRKTNNVAGWHHRLNRKAKKSGLHFYALVVLPYEEATGVPLQYKLLRESKIKRHRRKQTRQIQTSFYHCGIDIQATIYIRNANYLNNVGRYTLLSEIHA